MVEAREKGQPMPYRQPVEAVVSALNSDVQRAFGTVDLQLADWLSCAAVASSVLWLRELSKLLTHERSMSGTVA